MSQDTRCGGGCGEKVDEDELRVEAGESVAIEAVDG